MFRTLVAVVVSCCLAACAAPIPDLDFDYAGDRDDEMIVEDSPPLDPADELTVLAAVAPAKGCVVRGTLAGRASWVFFTRPDKPCRPATQAGRDLNIVDELRRLIDSVPAGGRIDGHIFNITITSIATALVNAQNRGVTVRITTDGQLRTATHAAKQQLDLLTNKVYCNRSCIANAADAISHTKLFTFSTATAPDGTVGTNVVWFGSANQTVASGVETYNNTVTIFGDAGLYNGFRTYLNHMYTQQRRADYYDPDSGRGHILASAADVYVSPEVQTDLAVNRLDDVTPDSTCRVRLMQASVRDSRMDVVNRVVKMKQGGCKVWVLAETVEPDALAALRGAGIAIHRAKVHDKVFLVYGKYGAAYEYRVYTGSQNLSGSAAHKYDEIFVKLAAETGTTHPIYDGYWDHFVDAYDLSPVY